MNKKEKTAVLNDIWEVFSRRRLNLSDEAEICEELNRSILNARMKQAESQGVPINRENRRLFNL